MVPFRMPCSTQTVNQPQTVQGKNCDLREVRKSDDRQGN